VPDMLAHGSSLSRSSRELGPSGAARLLVEVGDITRFPDRDPSQFSVSIHHPVSDGSPLFAGHLTNTW
jgi:hypothetical protein